MHPVKRPSNKKGFTLIELLIVLIILSILAGVVMMSIGGALLTARKTAYNTVKEQVHLSIVSYSAKHGGDFPLTGNTTIIDGKTLGIVDVCALLIKSDSGGLLGEIPDAFILIPGDDNCNSPTYSCSCDVTAHYIWAIDVDGNLYSSCINTAANKGGCKNTSSDGFQDAWP